MKTKKAKPTHALGTNQNKSGSDCSTPTSSPSCTPSSWVHKKRKTKAVDVSYVPPFEPLLEVLVDFLGGRGVLQPGKN